MRMLSIFSDEFFLDKLSYEETYGMREINQVQEANSSLLQLQQPKEKEFLQ
jgi:hypothetical protein